MTPEEAYKKSFYKNKRIPELEPIIATKANWSFYYAKVIIKGRWIEGEKIISTDPQNSYFYAQDVIKERFLEGEKIISNNPQFSYFYAMNLIKGPFHLCHSTIFNSELKDDYLDFLKKINCNISEYGEWLI
jgi:hypothetical protein